MVESIKKALLDIQLEYIQNATNPNYKWIVINSKIQLLYGIAKEKLSKDDELLKDISLTKEVIIGKEVRVSH